VKTLDNHSLTKVQFAPSAGPAGGAGLPVPVEVPRKGVPMALKLVFALVGGVVLGLIGTFQYNAVLTIGPWKYAPVGIIIAMVATIAWALFLRAWAGLGGVALDILGLVITIWLAATWRPGGDVVMPAGGTTAQTVAGYLWAYGAGIVSLVICFLPPRWFQSRPSVLLTSLQPVAPGTASTAGAVAGPIPAPASAPPAGFVAPSSVPAPPRTAGEAPQASAAPAGQAPADAAMRRRAKLAGDTRPPLASPARPAAPMPQTPPAADQPGNTSALS
jgi:hypothetical protein